MEERENSILNPDVDEKVNDESSSEQTPIEVSAKDMLHEQFEEIFYIFDEQRQRAENLCEEIKLHVAEREDALRLQLQSAYNELKHLSDENHALTVEINELRMTNADLERRVNDLQQQAEKRNFNVELRRQNVELQAELEDVKTNMSKRVRERVKESNDKIYEKINKLIEKQLNEVMASDGSHAWNKQRKLLLGIFWRVPEIGSPLDDAGDEMIENSRRTRQQAEQKEEDEKAQRQREEERADRTVDALERQAEKPASPIHMDVREGGIAIGNIEEIKGGIQEQRKQIEEGRNE